MGNYIGRTWVVRVTHTDRALPDQHPSTAFNWDRDLGWTCEGCRCIFID